MPVVGEHHEDEAREAADDRGQHPDHGALLLLERGVEARDRVGVQQRDRREHDERQQRVHEVPGPEPVLGQVERARVRVGEGPEAAAGHDAVVQPAVAANVAVREGGEAAGEAAAEEEEGAQHLVQGVAVACVGQEWAEELEHKHCSTGEQLYQVPNTLKGLISNAHLVRVVVVVVVVVVASFLDGLFETFFHGVLIIHTHNI
uniref:Uncharacterized protein n=1 Tax=Ananas comosus var. bracteatus TaxID=296719 RepID=A0A6V7PS42_ANACO|nr:unnamed protein product [Ananas comosus var. bracteatus]